MRIVGLLGTEETGINYVADELGKWCYDSGFFPVIIDCPRSIKVLKDILRDYQDKESSSLFRGMDMVEFRGLFTGADDYEELEMSRRDYVIILRGVSKTTLVDLLYEYDSRFIWCHGKDIPVPSLKYNEMFLGFEECSELDNYDFIDEVFPEGRLLAVPVNQTNTEQCRVGALLTEPFCMNFIMSTKLHTIPHVKKQVDGWEEQGVW